MAKPREPRKYNVIPYLNGVRTTEEEMRKHVFVNQHADIIARLNQERKFQQEAQRAESG